MNIKFNIIGKGLNTHQNNLILVRIFIVHTCLIGLDCVLSFVEVSISTDICVVQSKSSILMTSYKFENASIEP